MPGFLGTVAKLQSHNINELRWTNSKANWSLEEEFDKGSDSFDCKVKFPLVFSSRQALAFGAGKEIWKSCGDQFAECWVGERLTGVPHSEKTIASCSRVDISLPRALRDEKNQIRALDRSQPLLPLRPAG
jgi:hypothetical protein